MSNITWADKSTGDTVTAANMNEIKTAVNSKLDAAQDKVAIGNGADASATSFPVVVGKDATADSSYGTAVGYAAIVTFDNTYGGASGPEGSAIGQESKAYAWRATALGAKAHAAATSSTAVGAGSFTDKTHGVVIGRGSVMYGNGVEANSANVGGDDCEHVYVGNSWGHEFDTPPGGISIGNIIPDTRVIRYHGQDAYDAKAVVDSTNIDAGHVSVAGGRGTGTGAGGEVRFETAPVGAVGANVKNNLVVAGKFDAATSVDTRFLLLDLTDGTVKRVSFGADDSAGVGYKVLRVEN
jgi:hypothetical protein